MIFGTEQYVIFKMPEEKDMALSFRKNNNMSEWLRNDKNDEYVSFKKSTWINLEGKHEETEINPAGMGNCLP